MNRSNYDNYSLHEKRKHVHTLVYCWFKESWEIPGEISRTEPIMYCSIILWGGRLTDVAMSYVAVPMFIYLAVVW